MTISSYEDNKFNRKQSIGAVLKRTAPTQILNV